jgi:hypothetical protein
MVRTFQHLFSKIDGELSKLLIQEKQREMLGREGFMPAISTGQSLSKLVTLISAMIKESEQLKALI